MASAEELEEAKIAVLDGSHKAGVVDAELAASWERSAQELGPPWVQHPLQHVDSGLLDDRLLALLREPLDRFVESLSDTELVVTLTDDQARVLKAWPTDTKSTRLVELGDTGRGADVSERAIGTNAAGTALATGKAMMVRGWEHFARIFQQSICVGSPLRDPWARQMIGSVTLSASATLDARLMMPLQHSLMQQLNLCLSDPRRRTSTATEGAGEGGWTLRVGRPARNRMEQLEIQAICDALRETDGLRESAAERLGWSRSTLYRRMKSYRVTL